MTALPPADTEMNEQERKELRSLIAFIKSKNTNNQLHGLTQLKIMSSADARNKVIIREEGCIGPTVLLLASENVKIQLAAVRLLRSLSVNEENQQCIADESGIPPLINLLESPFAKLQLNAAATLWNLSVNDENKRRIAKEGAIRPLIYLLDSNNIKVQNEACGALRNLSFNDKNQRLIGKDGGISLLLDLLNSDDDNLKRNSAITLNNLTSVNEENKKRLRKEGGIDSLISVLVSNDINVLGFDVTKEGKQRERSGTYKVSLNGTGVTAVSLTTEVFDSVLWHDIKIEKKIGSGAYGDVYKARYHGYPVAVKVIKESLNTDELKREKILEELKLMCLLKHPNVVLLMGACLTPDNQVAIVTEMCNRGNLKDCLKDVKSLPQRLKLAKDIVSGLNWLHANNIIHRDLKLANLLVSDDWTIKITDFGLSLHWFAGIVCHHFKGNVKYSAPEILRARSDKNVSVYCYCIREGTPITMADGSTVPIERVAEASQVVAWRNAAAQAAAAGPTVSHNLDQGFKSCVEVTLADGRELVATPDHLLLTYDAYTGATKYVQAHDLTCEHYVVCLAQPTRPLEAGDEDVEEFELPGFGVVDWSDALCRERALAWARLCGAAAGGKVRRRRERDIAFVVTSCPRDALDVASDVEKVAQTVASTTHLCRADSMSSVTPNHHCEQCAYTVTISASMVADMDAFLTSATGVLLCSTAADADVDMEVDNMMDAGAEKESNDQRGGEVPRAVKREFAAAFVGCVVTAATSPVVGVVVEFGGEEGEAVGEQVLAVEFGVDSVSRRDGERWLETMTDQVQESILDQVGMRYEAVALAQWSVDRSNKQCARRRGAREDKQQQQEQQQLDIIAMRGELADASYAPTMAIRVQEAPRSFAAGAKQHVYDLSVPQYTSFVANGMVAHNCPQTDVYSFGLMLWELVTCMPLFPGVKGKQNITQHVLAGNRPEIYDEWPKSLKTLLALTWHEDPNRRPLFREIQDKFDRVIIDVMCPDPTGRRICKRLWKAQEMKRVSYEEYEEAFLEKTRLNLKLIRHIHLKSLCAIICDPFDDTITLERFCNCVAWFGPMYPVEKFLERIRELLQKDWFHGFVNSNKAAQLLKTRWSSTKQQYYLYRFSLSTPGCFALTFIEEDGTIVHKRISHSFNSSFALMNHTPPLEFSTLDQLHSACKASPELLRNKKVLPGSPFKPLFE